MQPIDATMSDLYVDRLELSKSDAEILDRSCEIIKDRLYFTSHPIVTRKSSNIHFFTIDDEFIYANFFADFGPLNLGMLYRYCMKVNRKLKKINPYKRILHYTQRDGQKKVNAAFLIGSYCVIYLNKTPEDIHQLLTLKCGPSFLSFRDASLGASTYNLTLLDCLRALKKAHDFGFFDFAEFDVDEYEYYEKVENGDLNWIVPGKFIAFAGPHSKARTENGFPVHSPETYVPYFRENNVSTVIRLNKKLYSADRFRRAGFDHFDLFFTDGSTPSDSILRRFLEICETADGTIAVHCKAGLGRTGTLIGCYLMRHYGFTAADAIAWLRIARPGSVIGPQQNYLEEMEPVMCSRGPGVVRSRSDLQQVLSAVDGMQIAEQDSATEMYNSKSSDYLCLDSNATLKPEASDLTQGDYLNRIKGSRGRRTRHLLIRDRGGQALVPAEFDPSPATSVSKTQNKSRERNGTVKRLLILRSNSRSPHSLGKRKKVPTSITIKFDVKRKLSAAGI